jgi:hypothetical protein
MKSIKDFVDKQICSHYIEGARAQIAPHSDATERLCEMEEYPTASWSCKKGDTLWQVSSPILANEIKQWSYRWRTEPEDKW